uniref:Phospholipid phosphatase related 2a n=1 Tax=Oryzias sinensis TaxID=183150 RepID=A0A8C7WSA2_9TELE
APHTHTHTLHTFILPCFYFTINVSLSRARHFIIFRVFYVIFYNFINESSICRWSVFPQILVGELCAFFTKAEETQEKTIVTADCCYFYPLLRRIVRFLGVYAFGFFTTTIFSNAGQVVTGNQTPHFLSACRPNYTALGCQSPMQYITERRACTGNPLVVMSARKSFPCKDAALSVYSALYTMYVTLVFRTKGTRLTKPTISLTLLCLAMLVGVVRVAEYRNHWSDVLAGFFTGGAIAVFLVRRVGQDGEIGTISMPYQYKLLQQKQKREFQTLQ